MTDGVGGERGTEAGALPKAPPPCIIGPLRAIGVGRDTGPGDAEGVGVDGTGAADGTEAFVPNKPPSLPRPPDITPALLDVSFGAVTALSGKG